MGWHGRQQRTGHIVRRLDLRLDVAGRSCRRCCGNRRDDRLLRLLLLLLWPLLASQLSCGWWRRRALRRWRRSERRWLNLGLMRLRLRLRLLRRLRLRLLDVKERRLTRKGELQRRAVVDQLMKQVPGQARVNQRLQVLPSLGEDILRLLLLLRMLLLRPRLMVVLRLTLTWVHGSH